MVIYRLYLRSRPLVPYLILVGQILSIAAAIWYVAHSQWEPAIYFSIWVLIYQHKD
jgi:hypothetical protein